MFDLSTFICTYLSVHSLLSVVQPSSESRQDIENMHFSEFLQSKLIKLYLCLLYINRGFYYKNTSIIMKVVEWTESFAFAMFFFVIVSVVVRINKHFSVDFLELRIFKFDLVNYVVISVCSTTCSLSTNYRSTS